VKRTGDWGRKKPLPRTGISRRGALVRNAATTRAAAKPRKPLVSKSKPVTPEERRARNLVALRSEGRCEGCQFTRATDWAHRKGAAQGGPWCPSNGLHLCRLCHDWAHHEPDAARALGWMVRRKHDHTLIPVQLPAHGLVLLGTDGSITPATEKDAA
jgi:hypothetical protein